METYLRSIESDVKEGYNKESAWLAAIVDPMGRPECAAATTAPL